MTLANDIARCIGHGAGPSGTQLVSDCINCRRRTAPRPAGQHSQISPPQTFPCPLRIAPAQETAA